MKKTILTLMLTLASNAFLGSCGDKSRVDELKDLVEEVKEDGGTYTEEQWEKVNKQFSEIMDKLNGYDDLTLDELKEVAVLQGEYAAAVFKSKGKQAMESVENFFE